jgi:molybdopterin/thiamine biosynthesis adenylyltransferase
MKKLIRKHNEIFVNRYGARLIDAEVTAIVNYLDSIKDFREKSELRFSINSERTRLGKILIYADYLNGGV